ncbi:aldo/keto reductase [Micrococcales bacterium 31B]|nr:aldo/keto reductase [Micrococcales bacterium 31B]
MTTSITPSRIIVGCMGLGGGWNDDPHGPEHVDEAEALIDTALELGFTVFDHADIYGRGKSERVFGDVLARRPDLRERMVIQTKCGIRIGEDDLPNYYNLSAEAIVSRAEASRERLQVETIDTLLLHRPDALMDPAEVAAAFTHLEASGTVRAFGVSNMSAAQIAYLKTRVKQPLVANQLQLSLGHRDFIEQGVRLNTAGNSEPTYPHGTWEYCVTEGIAVQAWSPLDRGKFVNGHVGLDEGDAAAASLIATMAAERGVTPEAIQLGWLMRHPAAIQPVTGTKTPERLRAVAGAEQVAASMSYVEWYRLWIAARGEALP